MNNKYGISIDLKQHLLHTITMINTEDIILFNDFMWTRVSAGVFIRCI